MRRHDVDELVFSSSATVYGANAPVPMPRGACPLSATNPYGRTKVHDRAHAARRGRAPSPAGASRCCATSTRSAPTRPAPSARTRRASPTTSCRSSRRWRSAAARSCVSSVTTTPPPTAPALRDYIHVEDLAAGHLAALDRLLTHDRPGPGTCNLGTGHGHQRARGAARLRAGRAAHELPYEIVGRRAGDIAGLVRRPDPRRRGRARLAHASGPSTTCAPTMWRWQSEQPAGYPD